ncbi:MBL fold metallo-hydrolase [Ahrensia sp. 13_GOM-1096m]|uniref:MBL fold metallo-hydrolase n=1 Tax=Ahrensia sp. 13_GOM-1096m TaxID=1380380 RepID=UPI0005591B81|nr:MBL fold metallo-hydrolase [Ahrensia sp. 13_GOM-1096m]
MARVTLLGTKGGPAIYPTENLRLPASSLLEMGGQAIVVDCGLGVTRGIVNTGHSLKSLSTIVITHLHSDHYLELGPLLHTAWTAGLQAPVAIWGPKGIDTYWQAFLASMAFDINLRIEDEGRVDLASLVTIHELAEGEIMLGDLSMRSILNCHPPIEESYALRFSDGSKSIVLSGDTAPFQAFNAFVDGADVLVHEAMMSEGVERLAARVGNGARLKEHLFASHTDASDVGKLAKDCQVQVLALNHLVPVDDPLITDETWTEAVRSSSYDGDLHIGQDGLVIDF